MRLSEYILTYEYGKSRITMTESIFSCCVLQITNQFRTFIDGTITIKFFEVKKYILIFFQFGSQDNYVI